MRICKVTLLIGVLIMVGCSPAPADDPTGEPTTEVTEVAPPTATDAPTTTEEVATEPTEPPTVEPTDPPVEPVQVFELSGDVPAISAGFLEGFNTATTGPIVKHEDTYYLFYTSFPEERGGETAIFYATSEDSVTWTRIETPLLMSGDLDWSGVYAMASGMLIEDDGANSESPLWVMYISAWRPTSAGEGRIYRATAPNAGGAWTVDADPIVLRGEEGEWDDGAIWGANVVKTDSGYLMVYSGSSIRYRTSPGAIGAATSEDGLTWTKYDDPSTTEAPYAQSDPVMSLIPESWESENVGEPHIQPFGDGYLMSYLTIEDNNERAMGLAYSEDGIHWERDPRNPVLAQAHMQGSHFFHSARLFCEAQECRVLVEIVDLAAQASDLWLAEAIGPLRP